MKNHWFGEKGCSWDVVIDLLSVMSVAQYKVGYYVGTGEFDEAKEVQETEYNNIYLLLKAAGCPSYKDIFKEVPK